MRNGALLLSSDCSTDMTQQHRPTLMKPDGDGSSSVGGDHSSAGSSPALLPNSPATAVVTDEEVISGRFFLRQLCLVDKYFGMLAEDYLERILQDHSTTQSINNWNIIAVTLADHGLQFNDEVLFRLMSGDSELASGLTEDIHRLKDFQASLAANSRVVPRWRVLTASGQKETPLKQRLNPFVMSKESGKPPTSVYVFDADRLGKTRAQVMGQMKELENKLQRAKEKRSQDVRAAEAAAQQKLLEEQISSINLHKSDMLKLLEGLETKFLADERRINQMRRLAGDVDSGDAGLQKSIQRSQQGDGKLAAAAVRKAT